MLGANRTAHAVARDFGHEDVFQLLMERTPHELKLALACELGDEAAFREMMALKPRIAEVDYRKLPDAAQNNNTNAVRLMLQAGWPVDARGQHGATALHWAAFHGNAEMARVILQSDPSLEMKSLRIRGTAPGWGVYGSGNGWHRETGDYVGAIEALLDAGAKAPRKSPQGWTPARRSWRYFAGEVAWVRDPSSGCRPIPGGFRAVDRRRGFVPPY